MDQKKKQLLILTTVAVVVLLGFIIFFTFQKLTKGTIKLTVIPRDATVYLDGEKITLSDKGERTLDISPDKHTLTAERKGFQKKTQDVQVNARETKEVQLLMNPSSQEGKDYFTDNPNDALPYEGKAGEEYSNRVQKIIDAYPFLSLLPYRTDTFIISYGASQAYPDDDSKFAIYISYADDASLFEAKNWLISQGARLDSLEIVDESMHLQ